jgi:hypothetical protein
MWYSRGFSGNEMHYLENSEFAMKAFSADDLVVPKGNKDELIPKKLEWKRNVRELTRVDWNITIIL